jgi:hypothetical protein
MASRKLWLPSEAVYQAGRGSDPMIEVGITIPAEALYMRNPSVLEMQQKAINPT